MRTIRSLAAFGIIAAAAASLTLLGWREFRPQPPAGPPSLECPAEVDLGPQEFGSTVVGRFRVANRGGSEMLLTRFGTSCSCAGVEIEQDGLAKRVEELRVPAGGHVELSVRISVATRPGSSQTVFVRFTTTDPESPDAAIKVVIPQVTGGLSAEPAAVVFGEIPTGQPAAKIIRLYSNGLATRRVHSVRSLHPDRFDARLVSLDAAGGSAQETDRLVAVVEVITRVDRPGRLDGTIEVVLNEESRASDKIAVLGEVVPPVIARPSTLVLPRYANGKPVSSGQIVLMSRDGAELGIAVESVPDGLTAAVRQDPDNPGQWMLDVGTKTDDRTARTVAVRLRASFKSGGSTTLDIPITIVPAKP